MIYPLLEVNLFGDFVISKLRCTKRICNKELGPMRR